METRCMKPPLENLSHYLWTNGFLSNPAPGENLVSGNLVMETECMPSFSSLSPPPSLRAGCFGLVRTIINIRILVFSYDYYVPCWTTIIYQTCIILAIFCPSGQFCEIDVSLLSLRNQPRTAPNLFQRGVEYGKYGGPDHPEGENISRWSLDFSARAGLNVSFYETPLRSIL